MAVVNPFPPGDDHREFETLLVSVPHTAEDLATVERWVELFLQSCSVAFSSSIDTGEKFALAGMAKDMLFRIMRGLAATPEDRIPL
jgi:hypothetical protein